jgi:GNAT superfamily N-acetyltransferase
VLAEALRFYSVDHRTNAVMTEPNMRNTWNTLVWREEPRFSDVESIKSIVESSGFFSHEEHNIAVELIQESLLNGLKSGYRFLFAENRDVMMGYACFGPIPGTKESYDLYWIAVRNEVRGTGLGKMLLKKTEDKIRGLGGKRIYVETSSRELYGPTQYFYASGGYKKEAILKDFYGPKDDKIIYAKAL